MNDVTSRKASAVLRRLHGCGIETCVERSKTLKRGCSDGIGKPEQASHFIESSKRLINPSPNLPPKLEEIISEALEKDRSPDINMRRTFGRTCMAFSVIRSGDGLNFVFVADGTSKSVIATIDFTYSN